MKRIISFILILVMTVVVFASCEDNDGFVASLELDSEPKILDPQLAETLTDTLIVRNIYEGLTRKDKDGNITAAAAKDYEISDDGLTYTFDLRSGLKWSDGSPLKAQDFEFAFKRALDPSTKAPYAYLLEDVSSYKAESDSRFIITLKKKNDNFLNILSYSVCMPCNESFFNNAKGRYGLDYDYILSNGSFYISKWIKDGEFSLRITSSDEYAGIFKPYASSINITCGDIAERNSRMTKRFTDFGFVDYTNAGKGQTDTLNYIDFYNTTYVLLINQKGILESADMRTAIESSIHRNLIVNNLPGCFKNAQLITPPSLSSFGSQFNSKVSLKTVEYSPENAGELYRKALEEKPGGSLSGLSILYPKDDNIKILASTLAETWQQTVDGYVNIKESDYSEIITAVSSGQYDFAIIPITADNSDVYEYLSKFSSPNSYGFSNDNYNKSISELKDIKSEQNFNKKAAECLNILQNSHSVIPLVYSATVFAGSVDYTLPEITPDNGYIDFAFVNEK